MSKKNNFNNVFNEIKNQKKSKKFNRDSFDELTLAMLNSDVETEVVKSRNDDGVDTTKINVTKEFINGFIKPILKDYGVDNIEAETINSYEFHSVKGVYEFVSELIYEYMQTDKPFKFLPKENFNGTILIKDVEPAVKERRDINKKDENGNSLYNTFEYDSHEVLKANSSAPRNKRRRIK